MLDGKVTIVTGAASGIGRAAALLFAREGAKIVAGDINAAAGASLVGEIKDAGGEAVFATTDIADEAQVATLVGTAVTRFGRLDCAYNNAGIGHEMGLLTDLTRDIWDRVLGVNVVGTWLCLKHEIPAMLATGGGTITNMASLSGIAGVPMMAAYSASKHAVNGLSKTAAVEFAKKGIRINTLCPGVVNTETIRAIGVDFNKINPTAMGRISEPSEIAELALWLLSPRSSYVTGQEICIDGGMRAATSLMPD